MPQPPCRAPPEASAASLSFDPALACGPFAGDRDTAVTLPLYEVERTGSASSASLQTDSARSDEL